MEVTRKNFKDTLPLIENAIANASFVAIDGEFTGIDKANGIVGPFDTPEDRYHRVRQEACDFLMFQFGLCTFHFNTESNHYEARPFNFYVFPRPYSRSAPDCRFLCQSSSLEFLSSQGLDFNKVFRDGISYLKPAEETSLRETINLKHQSYNQFSSPAFFSPDGNEPSGSKGPISIPEEQKHFIDEVLASVTEFMNKTYSQFLDLPVCNGFQRKLIYQTVRQKFSSGIHLETKTGEKKERYIVVTKVQNENEMKKKEENKQKAELQELEDAIGFTRVVDMISKSGKLMIGHNMLLDLIHLLHQFLFPLPQDYEEFKSMTSCVFPRILDTKLMATTNPFKEKFPNTSLGDLHKFLEVEPFSKPEVEIPPEFSQYDINDNNLHEAGYDAYITGRCFISMAKYLGSFHKPPISHVSPSSPLVEPFINKLFLTRILDIPYMNLGGEDLNPPREHVFHVTFPKEWKTSDLFQLFSPFGNIQVRWINETSAYVCLHKMEAAETVLKSLNKKNTNYKIITYEQSRNGNYSQRTENWNRKRQHAQEKETEFPAKKIKTLNAQEQDGSAPPFVSRSITPPVPEEVKTITQTEQNATESTKGGTKVKTSNSADFKLHSEDFPALPTAQKGEARNKMFEEPTSW